MTGCTMRGWGSLTTRFLTWKIVDFGATSEDEFWRQRRFGVLWNDIECSFIVQFELCEESSCRYPVGSR